MKMEVAEFMEKMKKVSRLSGYPIERETVNALYKELGGEERVDLLFALKCTAYGAERPNLATILKHLRVHKSQRLELEAKKRREIEGREIDKMPDGEVKKLLDETLKRL